MRIVLRMPDGSEEIREVASLDMQLGDWLLEIAPEPEPLRVHLHVPTSDQSFCSFVVHHRCANTMTVELMPKIRDGDAALVTRSSGIITKVTPMAVFKHDDPEGSNKMRAMFGPGQVDQSVRQAMHMCWMMLPDNKKTVDEFEKQFRRIVDRAIKDLREDSDAFGLPRVPGGPE
jgi:hypothetical protein